MSEGDIYVKIKATPEFITSLFTRDEQGNRLVLELGEPDKEGFHTPTVTRDTSDNLVSEARSAINALLEAVSDLPVNYSEEVAAAMRQAYAIVAAERWANLRVSVAGGAAK